MNLHRLRMAFQASLLLCVLVLSGTAWAHSSSNSYLTLSLSNGQPTLRTDISLRDIDLRLDLDQNRDGLVQWSEVQLRNADLTQWMQQGLALTSPDGACTLTAQDLLASQHSDGYYLSTQWAIACPAGTAVPGTPLTLAYSLIFDQDNLHRGLLRLDIAGAENSYLLSPEQPTATVLGATESAFSVLKRYIIEGVWHIWIGADHILFLLSLLLLAPLASQRQPVWHWRALHQLKPAVTDVLAVVTAFTVAHSITLSLSVLQWLEPPVSIIEPIIALSVVLAALNNLMGWFAFRRWQLALVFGLIHGFGFANVLLDLGLPAKELAVALGGFNVGVELGQLAIVAAFFPLAWVLRSTRFYRWAIVVAGSTAIATMGTIWLITRLMG